MEKYINPLILLFQKNNKKYKNITNFNRGYNKENKKRYKQLKVI